MLAHQKLKGWGAVLAQTAKEAKITHTPCRCHKILKPNRVLASATYINMCSPVQRLSQKSSSLYLLLCPRLKAPPSPLHLPPPSPSPSLSNQIYDRELNIFICPLSPFQAVEVVADEGDLPSALQSQPVSGLKKMLLLKRKQFLQDQKQLLSVA